MIVESEPNGFLMVRYKLYFNQQRPDPEDSWVLAYLAEHGLEPRRQLQEEHDGVSYRVLHFGQCYLGRHVANLGDLYKKGVEHSVLAQHIQSVLSTTPDDTVHQAVTSLDETAKDEVATKLAAQLYDTARFEADSEQRLAVHIDAQSVYQMFLACRASSTATQD